MNSKLYLDIDNLSAQSLEDDAELIPLLTPEDEEEMDREDVPEVLPILPLRNTVLFPGVVIPITAGRDTSIALIKAANQGTKTIGVVAQKDASVEEPGIEDVYTIGTVAKILRVLQMPDGNTTIIIQGKKRFQIDTVLQEKPYMQAAVRELKELKPESNNREFEAMVDGIKEVALKIIKINPNLPSEASFAIQNIQSGSFLINFVSSNLNLRVDEKQELLAYNDLKDRALKTLQLMNVELQRLELKNDIQSKVRSDLDQQQREYFLHQQMKTIQEELGGASHEEEIEEMRKQSTLKHWTDDTAKLFERELSKLQRMNPQVAEYAIQRNYLELFLELPWKEMAEDAIDISKAKAILDRDHHGLTEVKKRILEHLAVLKLKGDMKSPILCLYGPPGVGKTSLGKSIAEAMGRPYVRMSLGGLRDEAEIRGHRKTYIGAMPGRIIQNIKKAGVSNPVFILDEIDKLAHGVQGDPSSALLEVLDPEQNDTFYDNFLEAGYDLSKVMFIATANAVGDIQPALRDRMELIEVNGYAIEEKVEIAQKHLLPKQLSEHGLKKSDLKLSKKMFEKLISGYTRESGVRNLQKQLAKVARSVAIKKASEQEFEKSLNEAQLTEVLGKPRFSADQYETNEVAGVVTGLAWTSVGGAILFIESSLSKGKGGLSITGNLGTVMKESATIALQYIKANYDTFGISPEVFDRYNIHIHVPEGATPKDGPSAGITLLTSLVSLLTQRKVRSKLAMTGEITLRGKVLPVGGIKEKILAAKRAAISTIILSKENEKDILEIEPHYLKGLTFHYVERMNEVIEVAVTKQKVKHPKNSNFTAVGPIRIAIDGYSSTGKSTLAKALAKRLGYLYVDTGAMYRAVALYLIENGLTLDQLIEGLDQIQVDFDSDQQIRLNGRVVASEIRHMEVNQIVSQVAKIAQVRKKLVEQQQRFTQSVVMDGRDIGTVVFPDAQLKIFMTAKPEVRAQRRYAELKATHAEVAFDEVLENLKMRDFEDENRRVDPLKKAEDSVVLDNSDLSPEEQLGWVMEQLQDRKLV